MMVPPAWHIPLTQRTLRQSVQLIPVRKPDIKELRFMYDSRKNSSTISDNREPIRLNVLENKNSAKRTVKSLSELDVILDVVDQSIEMVL